MFGVCSGQRCPPSMFLFPFQCSSPPPAAITFTSSTPSDSDVTPEVDVASAQCRRKLDAIRSVSVDSETCGVDPDDGSCSEVDVMTSRPNSVVDDDDKRHRCDDDVTVTSSAVTSPSRELKFGIDRILVKNNDAKDTSPIGIAFCCYCIFPALWSYRYFNK